MFRCFCRFFFHKSHLKNNLFHIFPTAGNFDIDAGDMGWGPFSTPKKQKITKANTKKYFVRKLFTLLDHFSKMFENIFKISSYIQKTTPNPINALILTNYSTKHSNTTKIHCTKSNTFEKNRN